MSWQPPRAPRGLADVLPGASAAWRRVEETARELCERYGYREIRVPLFESTELYVRGMGEVTDVVEKEMFRVGGPPKAESKEQTELARQPERADDGLAREREDFSLRPEFTAGVVRAYREHNLDKSVGFMKVYAIGPLFRYERPQKGRLRQFHQVNLEALATSDPRADVEAIALVRDLVEKLGIPGFRVRLNSIGHEAPECRGRYRELLRDRLRPRMELARKRERVEDALCELCCQRFERNVFRVLDCKRCAAKTADVPPMAEHLCPDCTTHFQAVRAGLDRQKIPYAVDARLVRGFDYYTRTVFEFPCERLGAQDALGGGGRYDRLIPDMGGPEVGACGLALGIERLLIAMGGDAAPSAAARPGAVFVAALPDPRFRDAALDLAQELRLGGIDADLDLESRSLKSQMKSANKDGFAYVAILGDEELERGLVGLKSMAAGEGRGQSQVKVSRPDFVEHMKLVLRDGTLIPAGGFVRE